MYMHLSECINTSIKIYIYAYLYKKLLSVLGEKSKYFKMNRSANESEFVFSGFYYFHICALHMF